MRNAISIVFLFAIGFLATQNTKAQLAKTPVTETASVVRRMVDVYVQSIVDADAKLGATVWSPTSDVSFIEATNKAGNKSHPSSTSRPWVKCSRNDCLRSSETRIFRRRGV